MMSEVREKDKGRGSPGQGQGEEEGQEEEVKPRGFPARAAGHPATRGGGGHAGSALAKVCCLACKRPT